jgi:hypothetical protein
MAKNQADNLVQLPTEAGSRFYKTHTGLKVPSVTTILGVIAKPALIPWAANVEREAVMAAVYRAYEEISEITDTLLPLDDFMESVEGQLTLEKAYQQKLRRAGSIGTNVHKRIEWEFKAEQGKQKGTAPILQTADAERSFERFEEWRKETKLEILDTERKVVSLHGKYAGTLDTLCKINGKVCVLDFKTGKRVYLEALLQNCGYRMALAEEGIKTETGFVILLPKTTDDKPFDTVEVPPIDTLIEPWLSAISLYRFQHGQSNS